MIVVTGAAGRLGRRVVDLLVDRDYGLNAVLVLTPREQDIVGLCLRITRPP